MLRQRDLDSARFRRCGARARGRDSVCARMPKTRRTARRAEFLASASRGDAELGRALRDALAQRERNRALHASVSHLPGRRCTRDAARDLLALFPGGSVLDPFCGGGTVLVEARAAGRRALGCDVSPVAVRVARARCATPDDVTLSALRSRARALAARARAAVGARPPPRRADPARGPHLVRRARAARAREPAPRDRRVRAALRDLLEAIFSSILVKVSWRASDTKAAREKHHRPAGTTAVLFHKRARELARQLAELRAAVPAGNSGGRDPARRRARARAARARRPRAHLAALPVHLRLPADAAPAPRLARRATRRGARDRLAPAVAQGRARRARHLAGATPSCGRDAAAARAGPRRPPGAGDRRRPGARAARSTRPGPSVGRRRAGRASSCSRAPRSSAPDHGGRTHRREHVLAFRKPG